MEMVWVNEEQWHQSWWCKNPLFTTTSNPVNKPFTGKAKCVEINGKNNCKGYAPRTLLQKIFR